MYYVLGTVDRLLVRRVVILTVMIEVITCRRRIAKAVVALPAATMILGPVVASGRER
jgi:hypothetical protein